MSNFEKKEKNLKQLINKLNSLSLTYSQPTYEIEKIKTEKNEILRQKIEIENKNNSPVEWTNSTAVSGARGSHLFDSCLFSVDFGTLCTTSPDSIFV